MEHQKNVVGGTMINLLAILGVKTWAKTQEFGCSSTTLFQCDISRNVQGLVVTHG